MYCMNYQAQLSQSCKLKTKLAGYFAFHPPNGDSREFQRSAEVFSRKFFQECFDGIRKSLKGVSRKFKECFKECSCVFQWLLKEVLKGVSRKFQKCFKKDSRVFQGSFKSVSRKFQECFKEVLRVFQGSVKGVSCFREEEVSRMFHDFLRAFTECSRCFKKNFMLHGTQRSFPSRRRACFKS